jgi:hypothetical protein
MDASRPPSHARFAAWVLAVGLGAGVSMHAQQPADPVGGSSAFAATAADEPARVRGTSMSEMVVEDLMHAERRLDASRFALSTAALGLRLRGLQVTAPQAISNQLQVTEAIRGRIAFDRHGLVALQGGIASGRGFNGGWNATGLGTGATAYDLSVKQLFITARVSSRLRLEAGGLYFVRGQSTEATSYDNDGYLVGERANIAKPLPIVDTLSLTRGYVGDYNRPDVFGRLRRFDRANYYQALAEKRVGHGVVSVDYTRHNERHVVRAATAIDVNRRFLVHRIRLEGYDRLTTEAGRGYTVTLQRGLPFALMSAVGMSTVDPKYGSLNGDLYGTGRRLITSIGRRVSGSLLVSAQIARALSPDASSPRTRFDLSIAYDVLRVRQR